MDCVASTSSTVRELTDSEIYALESDNILVSTFKQDKLEREAKTNWDKFYMRNETKFFKDRHWTVEEFGQLCSDISFESDLVLFEAGCGVGNFLFPFLTEFRSIFAYACDFSPRAVDFVQGHQEEQFGCRIKVFVFDLSQDEQPLVEFVPSESVDICTLIFVLSAIHPTKMKNVLSQIIPVLKPGGSILVRDYGLYDHAMLRFDKGHKLQDNFYVRQDGTRAFYFTKEKLEDLFTTAGYETVFCYYVRRQTINRKEGLCVPRTFVQGRFRKPVAEDIWTWLDTLLDSNMHF